MDKKNIIDGYKGIMPLDLTDVDAKLHKEMINQHYKDIELYNEEQAKLPKHLRYENTVMRVAKIHKIDDDAQKKRNKEFYEKQAKDDQKRIELYYRNK